VRERLYIPLAEWGALFSAIKRDHGLEPAELEAVIADRLVWIEEDDRRRGVIALENLPRFNRAFADYSFLEE